MNSSLKADSRDLETSFYFELDPSLPNINSSSHYETPHSFSESSSTQLYETCADIRSSEGKDSQVVVHKIIVVLLSNRSSR